MAVAATDITGFTKWPMGNGNWGFYFKYTGPASYTASGEVLSKTVCKAAMEGLSEIYSMDTPLAMPVGGATAVQVGFEPLNNATNTGTFHFFNGVDAHTHDLLVIGGQTAQTHAHDFLVKGGTASAGTDALNIKSTIIGKEAATDATNLAADVATKGGVQLQSTPTSISMISTDTLGKEQAANRTIAGSASATKGGVVNSTARTSTAESAAAGNYSTYICYCRGIGRM